MKRKPLARPATNFIQIARYWAGGRRDALRRKTVRPVYGLDYYFTKRSSIAAKSFLEYTPIPTNPHPRFLFDMWCGLAGDDIALQYAMDDGYPRWLGNFQRKLIGAAQELVGAFWWYE